MWWVRRGASHVDRHDPCLRSATINDGLPPRHQRSAHRRQHLAQFEGAFRFDPCDGRRGRSRQRDRTSRRVRQDTHRQQPHRHGRRQSCARRNDRGQYIPGERSAGLALADNSTIAGIDIRGNTFVQTDGNGVCASNCSSYEVTHISVGAGAHVSIAGNRYRPSPPGIIGDQDTAPVP